jgi:hypothetical protein
MCCKNFCKSHNVALPSTTIKKILRKKRNNTIGQKKESQVFKNRWGFANMIGGTKLDVRDRTTTLKMGRYMNIQYAENVNDLNALNS